MVNKAFTGMFRFSLAGTASNSLDPAMGWVEWGVTAWYPTALRGRVPHLQDSSGNRNDGVF